MHKNQLLNKFWHRNQLHFQLEFDTLLLVPNEQRHVMESIRLYLQRLRSLHVELIIYTKKFMAKLNKI